MRQHRPAPEKPTAIIEASTSLMTLTNFSYGTSLLPLADDFQRFQISCVPQRSFNSHLVRKIERFAQSTLEIAEKKNYEDYISALCKINVFHSITLFQENYLSIV